MVVTAPGRICLFGDHQDYLGLPVISCSINKEVILTAEMNNTRTFRIMMPDMNAERTIAIAETFDVIDPQDYLGAALRVVRRYGCFPDKGYTIILTSTIPINAGLSSSSAVLVAWIHFLLKTFGSNQPITLQHIAKLAYEAEVLEHKAPGGRMDQYTIALGKLLYIDTSDDSSFKHINTNINGLIVGVSGIEKNTTGVLKDRRINAEKAIAQVTAHDKDFDIKKVSALQVNDYMPFIEKKLHPYFEAAVKNYQITQKAYIALQQQQLDYRHIGNLLTEHHTVLKDLLQLTVARIDNMMEAALVAGAYGAKIVGSGLGGCIIALASEKNQKNVIEAILKAGAIAAYPVTISSGTKATYA